MATEQEITVQAVGVFDSGHNPWALPAGALLVANDVEITRDNVVQGRRGMARTAADQLVRFFNFQNYVVGLTPSALAYRSTSPFTTWTAYSTAGMDSPSIGSWNPVPFETPYRWSAAETAKSLFAPIGQGAIRIDSPTGVPVIAGMPRGRDIQAAIGAAGSAVQGQTRVAYRVVYGRKDANSRLILSAPSGRTILTNTNASTTTNDVTLTVTLPVGTAGVASTDFVQVYRTSGTVDIAETSDPGDECYLVAEVSVPAAPAITNLTRVGTTVTVTTSSAHGLSTGQHVWFDGTTNFPQGVKVLTGTPLSTTFTYTEAGAAVSSGAVSFTAYPVTMTLTDSQPDGTGGASLYTNPTQETILNQNIRPPAAAAIAEFGGCLWFADVEFPSVSKFTMLGIPSAGAVLVLGGTTVSAGASEDAQTYTFQRFTAGTPYENLTNTTASLVRVVNRAFPHNLGFVAIGQQESSTPGGFSLFTGKPGVGFSVTLSQPTVFANQVGTVVSLFDARVKSGVVYSKPNQPDHISQALASAPIRVGSDSEEVKRLVPTRSALFILKNDGVWKATGGNGEFSIQPLDPTTSILAPESAVALDNHVYCLTDQGVARISESGVEIISRPVEQTIAQNFTSTAMASASEADHKYRLWNTSGFCAVYDPWTKAWTFRQEPFLSTVSAVLNERTTGRLLVSGTSTVGAQTGTYLENLTTLGDSLGETVAVSAADQATTQNTYNITHGASTLVVGDTLSLSGTQAEVIQATDATHSIVLATALPANGTYSVYRKTGTRTVSWQIRPSRPGMLNEWQELVVNFLANLGQRATVNLATDFVTSGLTNIDLDLVQTRLTNGDGFNQIRVWPAREDSLSAVLVVTLSWASSLADIRLAGLTTRFVPSSWQVSR